MEGASKKGTASPRPFKRRKSSRVSKPVIKLMHESHEAEDIFYYDEEDQDIPEFFEGSSRANKSAVSLEAIQALSEKMAYKRSYDEPWLEKFEQVLLKKGYVFAGLRRNEKPLIFKCSQSKKRSRDHRDLVYDRWEDIVLIDDFHRYFDSIYAKPLQERPKTLLPFSDIFYSKSNFTEFSLDEFYNFVARYFFGYSTMSDVLGVSSFKKLFVQQQKEVSLIAVIKHIFSLCRKTEMVYKLKILFTPLIGNRFPRSVLETIDQISLQAKYFVPEVVTNGIRKVHEAFRGAFIEAYSSAEIKPEFVSSKQLRFLIKFNFKEESNTDHKPIVEVIDTRLINDNQEENQFLSVLDAIEDKQLDLLMHVDPKQIFLEKEITAARRRRIELKIVKVPTKKKSEKKEKLKPFSRRTRFGDIILEYKKMLSKFITPYQLESGELVLKDTHLNIVYESWHESILGGCFDSLLTATNLENTWNATEKEIDAIDTRRLYIYNNQYEKYCYSSFLSKYLANDSRPLEKQGETQDSVITGKSLVGVLKTTSSNRYDEVCALFNLLNSFVPEFSIIVKDSILIQNRLHEEVTFTEVLAKGYVDTLLLKFGSLPFECYKDWFLLASARLRAIKSPLARSSINWHLLSYSKRKKNKEELNAAFLCYSIGEFLCASDCGDVGAYVFYSKFVQLCSNLQGKIDTYNRKSFADKHVALTFKEVTKLNAETSVIFFDQKDVDAVVSSFSDKHIGKEVVRLAYILQLGRLRRLSTIIFTGAGIGTGTGANLPTVRGYGAASASDKPFDPSRLENAAPTLTHMVIKALVDTGYVSFVCTQNIENLHRTSGLSRDKLWEVHGNIFDFECSNCGTLFDEFKEVPLDMLCPNCSKMRKDGFAQAVEKKISKKLGYSKFTRHSGSLRRKVIRHYGENVSPPDKAKDAIARMKCCIVVGSSLKVGKIAHFVCPPVLSNRPLLGIVNLGETKRKPDNWARSKGVLVNFNCDAVFKAVARLLKVEYDHNPPKCNRKIIKERGETMLDLKRIFLGERKVQK